MHFSEYKNAQELLLIYFKQSFSCTVSPHQCHGAAQPPGVVTLNRPHPEWTKLQYLKNKLKNFICHCEEKKEKKKLQKGRKDQHYLKNSQHCI